MQSHSILVCSQTPTLAGYDEFEQLMGGKLMGQHLDKSKGDTLPG